MTPYLSERSADPHIGHSPHCEPHAPDHPMASTRTSPSSIDGADDDPSLPGSVRWAHLVLLIPMIALLLGPAESESLVFLWLLGLVPVVLVARQGAWRDVAVSVAVVVTLIFVTHILLGALGRPLSPLLPVTLLTLLATSAAIGWLSEGIDRSREDDDADALTDRETGLPNRRHARVFLETMFGAAERGRPVTVVLFDLDRLRRYTQRHGPRASADAVLRFAELLAASTRRMNLSARLGDEEFISILSGSDEEGARAFADRVRESFQAMHLEQGSLTVSAGVASYHPSMRSPQELVAAADLALYRAKEEGRNRVRVFGRDIGSEEIRAALRESARTADADRDEPPYGDDPARIGRRPPPAELLPSGVGNFGSERSLLLVEHGSRLEEAMGGYLRQEGFAVTSAPDASSAIQALGTEFDLVITDLHLPGLSGTELVRAVKSRWPATQVLVVTEAGDARTAADALHAGGDRFLHPPLKLPEVQAQLVDCLARRDRLRAEHRRRHQFSKASLEKTDESRQLVIDGLLALARAAEYHDPYSRDHAHRVAGYSLAIHDALKEERKEEIDPELLKLACLVHNIGMLEVPEAILVKDGPLTPEEFERVRKHPETGRAILEPVLGDDLIISVAGWHHERWDGSGYPDGLAGAAIPLAARIVALADALNAMTTRRAYREPLLWEDAVRQVRDRAGTHFDPGLIEPFNRALPALHKQYLATKDEETSPEGDSTPKGSG